MDKIWLKSYPDNVPAEIDITQFRSVTHLLEESFHKYADSTAFSCMDKSMTYREVDQLSQRMAAWLQSRGLQPGARVAIMLPNVLQYPVAMAAILRAGYTVVNVNPLYTPRELRHQLIDSGAEIIIVLENFATTVEQVLADTQIKQVIVATMGDLMGGLKGMIVNLVVRKIKKMVPAYSLPGAIAFNTVLSEGARLTLKPVTLGHDDIAFLQYTGGTTGIAKGAVLLHRNVIANVLQNEAWLDMKPQAEQVVFVSALPLYHIYSLTVGAFMGMRMGGLNVLIPNPRDIPGFVKQLAKFKVTVFPAVNTLYNALLNNADFAKLDFSSYKVCNSGGMAVQQVVADRWLKLTGTPIIEGYGLSETSPVATANRVDIKEFTGTIGFPLPSTEVVILDDDGQPVPFGQPGEIAIRGPQVMAGYWNRPDETAKSMTPDGFFKTGDVGIMDERGCTRIVDRKKDMIIVSGFNVYPNEVEGVVAAHPGVLEVACIGVPDKNAGEAVKLFVVRKDPNLTAEQLLDFCKHELTAYKKPKYIEFRDELPKTNVGKILRRQLRDEKAAA
ncbi:long-chain-fatty-acid--CoA ligase [Janthinobacterium agaricidamnosum]|uniref:Long-chain-fatty-acid--CoA ligase n=1 Tax=Janthinobacterium agaricidamnosum NBRC 102515 = DSM 9628 TaxID=1349767 RepID=W0UWV0_9BURK|nr:long-chain-fatty-acid--CoA ligase [Janthinobacterium agaricidamnosum]CDG80929.1 AMP-binding enzyme family protein [Janthinobacterium agaricidamnosum NBRC 102515 = DSM 9628]